MKHQLLVDAGGYYRWLVDGYDDDILAGIDVEIAREISRSAAVETRELALEHITVLAEMYETTDAFPRYGYTTGDVLENAEQFIVYYTQDFEEQLNDDIDCAVTTIMELANEARERMSIAQSHREHIRTEQENDNA